MPQVEHIGIAVSDVAEALRIFRDVLGEEPYKVELIEKDGIRTHFIRGGSVKLELLEAVRPDSAIAKFLETRGGGLHHLALDVDDVDAALSRLTAAGYRPIDLEPRPGADGKSIAFLHPKQTSGILLELCSRRRSILKHRELVVGSRSYHLREAGSRENPPFLMLGGMRGIEMLTERIEQMCRVILAEGDAPTPAALGLARLHVAACGDRIQEALSMAGDDSSLVLSLCLICDGSQRIDAESVTCPVLIVAPDDEDAVAAALELRAAVRGSLAVIPQQHEALIAAAIEMHVRASLSPRH